jgi:hypothetical protein
MRARSERELELIQTTTAKNVWNCSMKGKYKETSFYAKKRDRRYVDVYYTLYRYV